MACRPFFKQLAAVAKDIDKEVTTISVGTSTNFDSKCSDDAKEIRMQKAVVTLGHLQNEISELQKCMSTDLSSFKNSHFVDMVSVTKLLLEKENSILKQSENYLKQYGYKSTEDDACNTEVSETVSNKSIEEENLIKSPSKAAQSPDISESDGTATQLSTPKLEDFGLSRDFFSKYTKLQSSLQVNETDMQITDYITSSNFRLPETPAVFKNQGEMSLHMPAAFDTTGVFVTPGLMTSQKGVPGYVAPRCGSAVPNARDLQWRENQLHSPLPPPVLTPMYPPNSKAQQQYTSVSTHKKEDSSPVLPELQTPCLKEKFRPTGYYVGNSSEAPTEPPRMFSECDTPEMPELTMKFSDLQSFKVQHGIQEVTRAQPVVETSKAPIPVSQAPTMSLPYYQLQRACVEEDDDDNPFPAMPELTGTYNLSTIKSAVIGNQDNEASSGHRDQVTMSSSSNVTGKENVQPRKRMALLTLEEYEMQPEYLTKIMPLHKFNSYMESVQRLFDESGELITEKDARNKLGHNAKYLLHALTKLKRLQTVKTDSNSECAYKLA